MAKFIILYFSLLCCFGASLHGNEKPHILVSVAPHKYFVEKIAGDTVTIGLMVPAGASAHTYEPTPKQVLAASHGDIWFIIGESFEARASRSLLAHNKTLALIDLRQGVDMITADPLTGACCCHANCQDLHIWLSARQAQIQAKTIADTLSARYPQNSQLYQKNLELFINELQKLDQQINTLLAPLKNRMIMVSHPAYAYFCRDYNLTQLSIEFEGKDPTPLQLTNVLNKARAAQTKKVYIQAQYNSKGAKLFAKELGAEVVNLDPYSEDYIKSMLEIAKQFSKN